MSASRSPIPRLADRLELLERPEGVEAVVAGRRRLRLSPDSAWLVAQLDGRLTVEGIAERLAERVGRSVSAAEARELLERTLVTHGIATFEAPTGRAAHAHLRVRTLHSADQVALIARRLHGLAHPATMGLMTIVSLGALGLAFSRSSPADWRSPLAWLAALPLAAFSLWLHEWMHAIAFSRAGGVPGAITFTGGAAPRLSTELPAVRSLPRTARITVDLAGVYAQWVMAGALAAAALALGALAAIPAIAAVLLLVIMNLLPAPGSDGAWLAEDLHGGAIGDRSLRLPSLRRLARLQRDRLAIGIAARSGGRASPMVARVLPTMLAMSFPDASAARLRAIARDSAVAQAWFGRDAAAVARGERPEIIQHGSAIRRLRAEGRGALVCSMHLGPFPYVPVALAELGCSVMAYAAQGVRTQVESGWIEAAKRQGASLEVLTATSSRDALRAVRGMRAGRFLALFMDGQFAASRDQHRADFRFLGQDLYMRTGPALLAASANVPIVLAACHWDRLGRRIVTFSDSLPPPDSREEAAVVARTAEMYRWFEPIVAAHPGQWPGWSWPIQHWRRTGASPTTTRQAFDEAVTAAGAALRGDAGRSRLVADPARAQWIEMGAERLLLDGPGRRVLAASELTCRVLDAAHARRRLAELPRRLDCSAEALAPEVARLTLSGLARIES